MSRFNQTVIPMLESCFPDITQCVWYLPLWLWPLGSVADTSTINRGYPLLRYIPDHQRSLESSPIAAPRAAPSMIYSR